MPALFLASSNADMDIHQAYCLGGKAYLVKLPTCEKLSAKLEDLKSFLMKHNNFPPACLSIAKKD